jgi:hypothetical protein
MSLLGLQALGRLTAIKESRKQKTEENFENGLYSYIKEKYITYVLFETACPPLEMAVTRKYPPSRPCTSLFFPCYYSTHCTSHPNDMPPISNHPRPTITTFIAASYFECVHTLSAFVVAYCFL